jgi:TetR/AcrR family transcriptional regulator, ethionamide resistance regulator
LPRKTNSSQADQTRRRRRKPEAAETEILDAAESFLREFPLRDMTVDEIMSRTGLSRPSFYEYFRDRNQLVIKLTERLNARDLSLSETWLGAEEPVEALRRNFREFAQLFATEGHLMRALVDAANTDPEVEANYRGSVQMAIDKAAQRIREDSARGLTSLDGIDPQELAAALVLMNQAFFIEKLGRRPQADPKAVADTLATIWIRLLYGNSR